MYFGVGGQPFRGERLVHVVRDHPDTALVDAQ
jgi:hypothetical protein